MTEFVIGVDGGGTKTHAVVASTSGQLLGFGHSGGSNWEGVGLATMREEVAAAIAGALTPTGLTRSRCAGAAFALAGCDWPSDVEPMNDELAKLELGGPRSIVNDAYAVLRAGVTRGFGVASVAGTGGSTTGMNRTGQMFRTFAISYGEGCGAHGLIHGALDAMARAHHGRCEHSAMTSRFLKTLGYATVPDLFEAVSRGREHGVSASLAPIVLDTANDGDEIAMGIAASVGSQHGADVVGVARNLGMLNDDFEVVCSGGVHRADSPSFRDAFAMAVASAAPRATISILRTPPVVGAVIMALESAGVDAMPLRSRLATSVASAWEDRQ